MIFVTLGSQKFQFNRLLKKIDELINSKDISDEVFAQIGISDYIPQNYKYKDYLDRDEFVKMTEKCDVFVTHGGTGAIVGALKKGKKVIAVPRLAEYDEHVDNHQLQILEQFDDMGIIISCKDVEDLKEAFGKLDSIICKPYCSNTDRILKSIIEYLNFVENK